MDAFDREPYGSTDFPTGATKPRLFFGIDPRLFAPIIVLILIGLLSRSLFWFFVMAGIAAAIGGVGKILGSWSPYFFDEFGHWLDRRSRTGDGVLPADGYWYGLDAPDVRRWRPQ